MPNATVPKDEDRPCRRGNRGAEQSVRVLLPKSRFPRFRSPSHSFRRANGTRPARADLARGLVDEAVGEEPRTGPALCLVERILGWPDMVTKGRCPLRSMGSYFGGWGFGQSRHDRWRGKDRSSKRIRDRSRPVSAKEKRRLGSSGSEARDERREGNDCEPVSLLH